ncbi:septation protein SepH [Modestobacter sp. I12A-02662]|uniref:septation protein SepH n=1 Tax=Modestobacter sp. I12A-02662 TaxID=1730496 RepID=UPI0034DED99B
MRALRLVALSDDGRRLVLTLDEPGSDEDGERFELPVDDRLRTTLRVDPKPGRPSPESSEALPPRLIQARIRAGETPEQVAAASGTSVERIMRFAHPVLQERERVAEQARDARVRLSEGTPGVPLEQFMAERLRLLGADLDAVSWDAHRSDDGTWHVRAAWRGGHKSGTTRWSYDIPAKTVTPIDATTSDFAEGTRLVRVVPDVPAGLPAAPVHRRGISVLGAPAEVTEAGDLVEEELGSADDVTDVVPSDGTPVEPAEGGLDHPDPYGSPYDGVDPDTQDTVVLGRLSDVEEEDPRARIPAWEDIVFGVRRHR